MPIYINLLCKTPVWDRILLSVNQQERNPEGGDDGADLFDFGPILLRIGVGVQERRLVVRIGKFLLYGLCRPGVLSISLSLRTRGLSIRGISPVPDAGKIPGVTGTAVSVGGKQHAHIPGIPPCLDNGR